MGRYAQRRIAGGGSRAPVPASLPYMTVANEQFSAIKVDYSAPINLNNFDPAHFATDPNLLTPEEITQDFPNQLTLGFIGDLSSETHLTYEGDIPTPALSPQTIQITHL